ncbi:MAG: hypothetical protein ACRDBG_23555 [Waterburya sp.]
MTNTDLNGTYRKLQLNDQVVIDVQGQCRRWIKVDGDQFISHADMMTSVNYSIQNGWFAWEDLCRTILFFDENELFWELTILRKGVSYYENM